MKKMLLAACITVMLTSGAQAQTAPEPTAADAYKVLIMVLSAAHACGIATVEDYRLYQQKGLAVLTHEARLKHGDDAAEAFLHQRGGIENESAGIGIKTAEASKDACNTTIAETYKQEKAFIDSKVNELERAKP